MTFPRRTIFPKCKCAPGRTTSSAETRSSGATSSRFIRQPWRPRRRRQHPLPRRPRPRRLTRQRRCPWPKVLEVSAAHEVAKELPVADPPQLKNKPGDWSSAGGAGETALAGAPPRPTHQRPPPAPLWIGKPRRERKSSQNARERSLAACFGCVSALRRACFYFLFPHINQKYWPRWAGFTTVTLGCVQLKY